MLVPLRVRVEDSAGENLWRKPVENSLLKVSQVGPRHHYPAASSC